jgi:cation:H+ antiporter
MRKYQLSFVAAACLVLQWLVLRWSGPHLPPPLEAFLSGMAIFGAAFLLSWAAELAQLDIPRGLAIAGLAVIAVLPEYAVDLYFAWQAARDPAYISYATANMTGANRLLIGVGWSSLVLIAWLHSRGAQREVTLAPSHSVEMSHLLLATVYAFAIPLKGTLSLIDAAVLLTIFASYARSLMNQPVEPPHLVGPPVLIASLSRPLRRGVTIGMFLYSAFGIFAAAEPFAESLIATGSGLAIPEYLLIQWVAPFASESPEFIVAILFVLRGAATQGLGMLLSSKVNQWTLLIGALPLAYAISGGTLNVMPLDGMQVKEIFLTAAQSLFGLAVLASFALSLPEAALLFVLFSAQLFMQLVSEISPDSLGALSKYAPLEGYVFAYGYVLLAAVVIIASRDARRGVRSLVQLPVARARSRRATSSWFVGIVVFVAALTALTM